MSKQATNAPAMLRSLDLPLNCHHLSVSNAALDQEYSAARTRVQ
jgi:hypothetical protein